MEKSQLEKLKKSVRLIFSYEKISKRKRVKKNTKKNQKIIAEEIFKKD